MHICKDIHMCICRCIYIYFYESQLAGSLLFANEVRIGGVGGVVAEKERNLAVPLC